jgi:hypothetical protein
MYSLVSLQEIVGLKAALFLSFDSVSPQLAIRQAKLRPNHFMLRSNNRHPILDRAIVTGLGTCEPGLEYRSLLLHDWSSLAGLIAGAKPVG